MPKKSTIKNRFRSMGDACIERILIDATFPWRKHKLNETKYYVNQLSETPEKMNEIPLKVNDTPGRQVREKTPESERTAARKAGRPWFDLNFKAKNARKKQDFCKFLAFLRKKVKAAILSELPS